MLPRYLRFLNYRCFAGLHRLELRQLTLLYGRNNAGKSALLRSLPLLADSIRAAAPLNLSSEAVRGALFNDLRWRGVEADPSGDQYLGLGLEWDDHRVDYTLDWIEGWKRLVLRSLVASGADGDCALEWAPQPDDQLAESLAYRREPQGDVVRLRFAGLSPPEGLLPELSARLRPLQAGVQWLRAGRLPTLERVQLYPASPNIPMGPGGHEAAGLLALDGELRESVSSWYEQVVGRVLRVKEVPGVGFRLQLHNPHQAQFDVDFADVGEGLLHALPVLTALARLELGRSAPRILAIEEPESHLHAQLQRRLTERLAHAAAQYDTLMVLETHSEHVLLTTQLLIARGELPPERVIAYWVHQTSDGQAVAHPVTFDAQGRAQGNLPPRMFADDTELAREILRARGGRP